MTDGSGNGTQLPLQDAPSRCPQCNEVVPRYLASRVNYVGCKSCGSWLKINKWGKLEKSSQKTKAWVRKDEGLLPGAVMTIDGVEYVLVSAVEKADRMAEQFTWREYMLFHPQKGYAYFSESDGHWMRLRSISAPEKPKGRTVGYKDLQFQLFQRSRSKVIAAAGEFPDNIYTQTIHYNEWISPPYFLSCETGPSYQEWFLGEYMEPADVKKLLKVPPQRWPDRAGVGPAQPSGKNFTHLALVRLSIVVIGFLFFAQIVLSMSAAEKQVARIDDYTTDSTVTVSPTFVLDGHTSNLYFEYTNNVSNNWGESDIMLINEQTGETRGLTLGAEYYSGYDDEGSWSDGSTSSNAYLSSVAPGRYHLNIKTSHGATGSGGDHFTLRVIYDEPVMSNFVIILVLVLLFPVISYFRLQQFEKNRWAYSD